MAGGLSARDLDKTYRGKMQAEVSEYDHQGYVWRFEGRAVLRTELSTPLRDIGPNLVGHIARDQLLLPRGAAALRELVQCTMTADEWEAHVEQVAKSGHRRLL